MPGERGDLVHRVAREIAARRRELGLTQEAFSAVLGIATWMIATAGTTALALYAMAYGVIGLPVMFAMRETNERSLDD